MSAFYDAHVTLIQATMCSMVLAASVQVAMRAGVFSLASVGFWGIGAYTSGILVRDHGAGVLVALGGAIVLSAVIALVLAVVFVRLRGMYLAMATAAFDFVVIVVALSAEDLTGGPIGLFGVPPALQMWQLVVIVAGVALLLAWSERNHMGRTIATVGVDKDMASSLGINVRSLQRRVFVLSGVLGAVSGGCNAMLFNNVSTDQFGFHLITTTLTMAVIGGLRSWVGAYIGAAIILWLPEVLRPVAEWRNAVFGALLIVVVTIEPGGLIGGGRKAWRFARRRQLEVAAPKGLAVRPPEAARSGGGADT